MSKKYFLKLDYDYRYVTDQTSGYRKSQLFNSALPSTYRENYSFRDDRKFRGALIGMLLIAAALFIAVFEYGVLDQIYIDLFLK